MTQQTIFDLYEKSARAKVWLDLAEDAAIEHAERHGYVTADDVRKYVPMPEGVDPRVMGALFKRKNFVPVGYQASVRRESHNRPIMRFKVKKND